jgi:diguanylate cyclase (GGDEF)-like protein/PAS domain S-box-containing protein
MTTLNALLNRLTASPLAGRLLSRWRPYEASEAMAARFRARQLQAVLQLTPLMMTANVVNMVIIVVVFGGSISPVLLAAWSLMICAVAVAGMRAWHRWRTGPAWEAASRRAMGRATLHATLLGALWGAVPAMLFADATPAQQLLLASVTVGMMGAGGFALATTPAGGSVFVTAIGISAAIALLRSQHEVGVAMSALLGVYGVIVIASVWSTARLFGARLMAEAEAAQQNEVIGLLLRDFEEHASDVMLEIDAQGRLQHVSPRLADLLGRPAEQLTHASALALLEAVQPDDEDARRCWQQLRQQLGSRQPFRDLKLATQSRDRLRWWSVSAKPLLDAAGRCIGWRGVASDITEAQQANHRLTWLAHFDPLTGLANRHHFRAQLAELLARPEGSAPFALLALDLDNFKTVNDTLGHAVGDGLLQAVAQRLRDATRRSDTVARLGGDEFAVILRDVASAAEAEPLTRRLLQSLDGACEVQGACVAVRGSIGVALSPQDGRDIDTLLSQADLALYAAKAAGRGDLRYFTPQMAATTRRRQAIEQGLRQAVARRELSLAFQPQVSLPERQVVGFEALLRWRTPDLGDVPPGEFVPVAEETGLIADIGAWVLQEACRHAATWPAPLRVSVNVSAVQAMSQDLCGVALQALAAHGMAPQRLELEITESIFLNETQATMDKLHALRRAGLRVALDDFGTGYSSLAYLRRFPFDTLKIDRSFVRELMTRRDARAIVRMIGGLARTLHIRTVAEGVEEQAQALLLEKYGCSILQGHLVAQAMPPDDVQGFLLAWPHMPRWALPGTGSARDAIAGMPATDTMPLDAVT